MFAALLGLPVPGPFWGEGWPAGRPDPDRPWDEAAERRRRHEQLLAKWREADEERDAPEPPA